MATHIPEILKERMAVYIPSLALSILLNEFLALDMETQTPIVCEPGVTIIKAGKVTKTFKFDCKECGCIFTKDHPTNIGIHLAKCPTCDTVSSDAERIFEEA